MVGVGLFDLEDQFAFYRACHNKVNVMTHVVCVWPLLFGGLIMPAYTQPLLAMQRLPDYMAALPFHEYMALNYCFVACVVYALFYVSLEYTSGSLAALLVLFCGVAANALAFHYPYTVGWEIAAIIEVVGWTAHSSLMVSSRSVRLRWWKILCKLSLRTLLCDARGVACGVPLSYEPYRGFNKNVQYLVDPEKARFRARKSTEIRKSALN